MRESQLYRDTLERTREIAQARYPDRLCFTMAEAAASTGLSVWTLNRRGLHPPVTCEQIARVFS